MGPNQNSQFNSMNQMPRRPMTSGGMGPNPGARPGAASMPDNETGVDVSVDVDAGKLGVEMNTASDTSGTASNGDAKKKGSKAMLIGMIILAILAAGGIGFGVWAWLSGNSRVAKKDEQIAELNNQVSSLAQEKGELSDRIAELEESNSEAQADITNNQEKIEEIQEQLEEEQKEEQQGYRVLSIGQCVGDGGTAQGGVFSLKCDATTNIGNGKFVYDSQSNTLKFVVGQ